MRKRKPARLPGSRCHPGRKALSFHESGHAVVGYLLGLELEQVTIIPNKTSLGQCHYRDWEARELAADLNASLVLTLAGAVAEEIATGRPSRGGDMGRALELAAACCRNEAEAERRIADARAVAARLLERHWAAVKLLSAALKKQRQLDGAVAARIIRRALSRPADRAARGIVLLFPAGSTTPLVQSQGRAFEFARNGVAWSHECSLVCS